MPSVWRRLACVRPLASGSAALPLGYQAVPVIYPLAVTVALLYLDSCRTRDGTARSARVMYFGMNDSFQLTCTNAFNAWLRGPIPHVPWYVCLIALALRDEGSRKVSHPCLLKSSSSFSSSGNSGLGVGSCTSTASSVPRH